MLIRVLKDYKQDSSYKFLLNYPPLAVFDLYITGNIDESSEQSKKNAQVG